MEGGCEENKQSDRGKKPFCLCKWEWWKQRHRHSSWPPGPCESSLSTFLFLSLPLAVYLSTPGPGTPIACSYATKEEEVGAGKEIVLAKMYISRWSWQWKVPPLPFIKIWLSSYHGLCKLSVTAGDVTCGHMHLNHRGHRYLCTNNARCRKTGTQGGIKKLLSDRGEFKQKDTKCGSPWTGFTLQESWQWKIREEGGVAGKKDRCGVEGWQGKKKRIR